MQPPARRTLPTNQPSPATATMQNLAAQEEVFSRQPDITPTLPD